MLDTSWIGHRFDPLEVTVEEGRLRLFAKAISAGETPCKPAIAPPTFPFCLTMELMDPFSDLRALGVNLDCLLHGEQSFEYFGTIRAGDRLVIEKRVADIFTKKAGALDFIVMEYLAKPPAGQPVCKMQATFIVRHPSTLQ